MCIWWHWNSTHLPPCQASISQPSMYTCGAQVELSQSEELKISHIIYAKVLRARYRENCSTPITKLKYVWWQFMLFWYSKVLKMFEMCIYFSCVRACVRWMWECQRSRRAQSLIMSPRNCVPYCMSRWCVRVCVCVFFDIAQCLYIRPYISCSSFIHVYAMSENRLFFFTLVCVPTSIRSAHVYSVKPLCVIHMGKCYWFRNLN